MTETDPKSASTGDAPGPSPPSAEPNGSVDEFAHIPSRRRPPVVALIAVALALFLAYRVRHDVAYALSSSQPQNVGDARALATAPFDRLPINRYVQLSGQPARESAVILDTQGSWAFRQFFRLHNTNGRVFVRRVADPLPASLAERDVFTGRLVRFGDLSFARSISRHFEGQVSATHFFRPAELHARLGGGPVTLTDIAGERVTLSVGERLNIDVARPGELRFELPRDRFPELARARALIEERGGKVIEAGESPAPQRTWTVVAAVPAERRDVVLSAIGDLDRRIRIRPARNSLAAALGDVTSTPNGLQIKTSDGVRSVALTDVLSIRTRGTVQVPADAVLLIEGERPRDQLKTLVILALLAGFAAVNLLALRRPA